MLQITIWFPDSVPSADAGLSFARKLGERRCHLVSREVPSPAVAARDHAAGARPTLSETMSRHATPVGHEFITTFDELRQDVYLEMARVEEIEGTISSKQMRHGK